MLLSRVLQHNFIDGIFKLLLPSCISSKLPFSPPLLNYVVISYLIITQFTPYQRGMANVSESSARLSVVII